jgi:hypothetical protein
VSRAGRNLAILAGALALAAGPSCRRRAVPGPSAEEGEAPAALPAAKSAPATAAQRKPEPRTSAPRGIAAAAARRSTSVAPRGDVDGVRADLPALGQPIPEGLRVLRRASTAHVYESPYSVESLRRFFQRELPAARIEPRAYGFRVVPPDRSGFILVTRRQTGDPLVSVVRYARTFSRPALPESPAEVAAQPH